MIGTIIGLIFLCLIAGFIWWAAQQLLAMVSIAEPFATFIRILVAFLVLIIVLYAFSALLGLAGIHVPMPGNLSVK
jgi:hypothetical protein